MVLPKELARFNRVVTNRVLGTVAGKVPGFGHVHHKGRRSGRSYRTPVNVFRTDDSYVIPLTYGRDTDWLKNVLAAGGCELETNGQRLQLTDPRIVHDEAREAVPPIVAQLLGLVGVTDFAFFSVGSVGPKP